MIAGWILMIAAVLMLSSLPPRTAFCLAGLGVELLGFVLLARTHMPPRRKNDA